MSSNKSPMVGSKNTFDDLVPKSNFFGGTFHRQSQSPTTMMQTKTNEQKLRVIQSNKKFTPVAQAISTDYPAQTTMNRKASQKQDVFADVMRSSVNRQFSTTHGVFSNDYQVMPQSTSVKRQTSPFDVKQNLAPQSTLSNAKRSVGRGKGFVDPVPPKLTNDSAEFSFRQLALARMKFGGEKERRASAQVHASTDSRINSSPPKRHSLFQNQIERRAGGPDLDKANEERLNQTQ